MPHKKSARVPRYDASNAKKSGIGVFIIFNSGNQILFGESARWRWTKIAGRLMLEVEEGKEICLHAWADHVTAVGGPQVLFRDAQWK